MNKDNNYTSLYLTKYLLENKDNFDNNELKFYLKYLASLKEKGYENIENTDIKILLEDLKNLNKYLSDGELTSLTNERLSKELELFDLILKEQDLVNISYELDKLYIECDMGARENSVLLKKIKTMNNKREK